MKTLQTFPRPGVGHNALGLGFFLLVCAGAAALGSLLTTPSLPIWYAQLRKPAWVPPNAVFAPVWTVLFAAMAVSAWLVWRRGAPRLPLALFAVQLALNVAWSGLFFALQAPGAALGEIVLLWLAILATSIAFARVSALAGALLIPYLLWVSFAAALNFELWRLNA